MHKTEQIIKDCPHFMYGCCQEYLDGDCSAHKCDLKIIRELQQKLQTKEQELTDLKERYEKLKKSNSNYATATIKRNFKLDKIKNIAKKLLPLTNEYDNCYYKDKCLDCDKDCQYRAVDAILQIIEGEF